MDRYRGVCAHADITINTLALDASGGVPWWPRPEVTLFKVLVHVLTETNRHAGHADILREQIDGAVGTDPGTATWYDQGTVFWAAHRAKIEALAAQHLPPRLPRRSK